MPQSRPYYHRLLGFDFGTKRIGVAVGDGTTSTATPLKAIAAHRGVPKRWQHIDDIIHTWNPQALILGIPINIDGSDQHTTELARQFSEQLQQRYNLPIHEADERLTTVEARQRIFDQGGFRALKKTCIDSQAAKLILEGWLSETPDI